MTEQQDTGSDHAGNDEAATLPQAQPEPGASRSRPWSSSGPTGHRSVGPASALEVRNSGDDGDVEGEERAITDLVEQPAKVMRIGSMIRQLLEEVKAAPLDEASRNRLKEIHQASIKELEEGLARSWSRSSTGSRCRSPRTSHRPTVSFGSPRPSWSAGWRASSTASRPRSTPSRWPPRCSSNRSGAVCRRGWASRRVRPRTRTSRRSPATRAGCTSSRSRRGWRLSAAAAARGRRPDRADRPGPERAPGQQRGRAWSGSPVSTRRELGGLGLRGDGVLGPARAAARPCSRTPASAGRSRRRSERSRGRRRRRRRTCTRCRSRARPRLHGSRGIFSVRTWRHVAVDLAAVDAGDASTSCTK